MTESLPVISLFSGAGGLDLSVTRAATDPLDTNGPAKSPYRIGVSTDYDPDTVKTYEANFPGVPSLVGDIRTITTQEILEAGSLIVGEAALVVGGPPCTPFSKSGFWLAEKRESRDPNASLLDEYARVVREAQPEAFILENVQGLTYRTHKAQLERLLTEMKSLGYNPQYQVLLAADYGVPQLRRRVFIVGRRDGKRFEFPTRKFAGDSEHTKRRDDEALPMHRTASEAFEGLLEVPEPGEAVSGSWQELAAEIPPGENYLWHTERKGGRNEFKWRTRYWTFLLRLSPDKPSSTIQAQPGPWVGPFHWENVIDPFNGQPAARRLRVPEIKRLQTFPDNFQVIGDRATAQRQIGNAVPVELGKVVVRALAEQLGHISSIATSTDTRW
ncbi:DNA cytosine methyltransferase [Arachnia propionica]|uniref:DNA (cytosine-5-)-methyltransferase n=1 Tax=Arachnia propionica TaxID=1750 RepID=A0AB37HXM2_9ACTN|nr:DNA (cytosine-5-)-methyltransferase [Arachnia propionica]QCT38780.1 DNA cytosine methyltransferase [Arachnia propionica]QUC11608.1 DNA (cytosine-5-)-methyltransferase [Arachnia propionica]RPA18439.1 DNA (cytosine-5-)-methyltransferase [Arachnia propionica]